MKDKNNGLEIGTKLYWEFTRRNYAPEIREETVSKIGRVYFEIENNSAKKFRIDSLNYEDKNYTQNRIQLYRSVEEIELKNELNNLHNKLTRFFSNYHHKSLTLEQLREINQITKATEIIQP